jgi:hypothetical protein
MYDKYLSLIPKSACLINRTILHCWGFISNLIWTWSKKVYFSLYGLTTPLHTDDNPSGMLIWLRDFWNIFTFSLFQLLAVDLITNQIKERNNKYETLMSGWPLGWGLVTRLKILLCKKKKYCSKSKEVKTRSSRQIWQNLLKKGMDQKGLLCRWWWYHDGRWTMVRKFVSTSGPIQCSFDIETRSASENSRIVEVKWVTWPSVDETEYKILNRGAFLFIVHELCHQIRSHIFLK